MRRTIILGAVGVAGVVTVGLLALPIASAVTDDAPAGKRDDRAEILPVEEDEDPDDTTDPTGPGTQDRTGPGTVDQSYDGDDSVSGLGDDHSATGTGD
ncbi:hypothetical protein [Nocardioides euryhalodurans]|uniref:Uncharacterized protein n=1 Tax=Nocardioides euryhalodurans TaxID=2518370 RepID=A0A4P7GI50_9ACTN|nr:hypothetical protein [Nocardioides euryhalodurans]QBR91575.1 hypothetical protein EXE57_04295 [Nocardioides euryhalodurans]